MGGFVAYAGLLVFLGALDLLLAFVFERIGLQPMLAAFVGLGIIGFIVIAVGGVLVLKGIKAFKTESLAPKRTIQTIQHLKGDDRPAEHSVSAEEEKPEPRSSEQIQAS